MSTIPNPYIGPRTFNEDERNRFFGRDLEANELLARVLSEQEIVFYAQSGAGKSSLVNTCLIPDLKKKGFEILLGRVGGELPVGFVPDKNFNIFLFNLLRSLSTGEANTETLAKGTLSLFLAPAKEEDSKRRALIIDQFEELFSTHNEAWEKRREFFEQLAQVLEADPRLRVVLVMREDYIASLDPYATIMPNRFQARYYMQRLEYAAALKAVKEPVKTGIFSRPYEPDVAEKLVDDLRSVKVQQPDGTLGSEVGQFVEPVQLQVVCFSLWEKLTEKSPNGNSITEKDLLEVGDVDQALGNYYAKRIAKVAETKYVKERLIREWIEKKLIAPSGIRSMVMQETNKKSGEISDDVIQALQSDLVRAENRGGAIWYELTHDRLVGPILANNKEWFEKNLSALQRQATLWNDKEKDKSWLLRDQALKEVQEWADRPENRDEVGELEQKFLEACQQQQREIEQEQEVLAARRQRRFTTVVAILGFAAVIAAIFAFIKGQQSNANAEVARVAQATAQSGAMTAQALRDVAVKNFNDAATARADSELQANKALSGSLVAQADSLKNIDYKLALLLGIEAYERDPENLLTRTTLFHLLQFTPYSRRSGFNGPVSSVAVSPDGKWVAAASCREDQKKQCKKGGIQLFNQDMTQIGELSQVYGDFGIVYSLAFYQFPDRLVLAAGGCVPEGCTTNRGQITLWDVSDPQSSALISDTKGIRKPGFTHTALVKTIAFSPQGDLLASGSYDTTAVIWKITDLEKPSPVTQFGGREGHSSFVNSVVFSPDGKLLISASDDKSIKLWDILQPKKRPQTLFTNPAPVNVIAFSPDGKRFAAADDDNIVLLWDWGTGQSLSPEPVRLEGHTGYVKSVAFNSDGTLLASAGFDNEIILWNTSKGEQVGSPLSVHAGAINSIVFGTKNQDGKESPYLISGSNDRTVIQWDLSARQPLSYTAKSQEELPTQQVLEASNSEFKASVIGQQIDVKYAQSPQQTFLTLDGFDSPVQYIKFPVDGQALLTVDENQLNTKRVTSWSIQTSQWLDLACEAVNRNLTPALWKQFIGYLNDEPPKETCVAKP